MKNEKGKRENVHVQINSTIRRLHIVRIQTSDHWCNKQKCSEKKPQKQSNKDKKTKEKKKTYYKIGKIGIRWGRKGEWEINLKLEKGFHLAQKKKIVGVELLVEGKRESGPGVPLVKDRKVERIVFCFSKKYTFLYPPPCFLFSSPTFFLLSPIFLFSWSLGIAFGLFGGVWWGWGSGRRGEEGGGRREDGMCDHTTSAFVVVPSFSIFLLSVYSICFLLKHITCHSPTAGLASLLFTNRW